MVMLFDLFNFPDDVFEILFATPQQRIVGKELVNFIKDNGGEITKTQMSHFATQLHDGTLEAVLDEGEYKGKTVQLSYNKRQFYDRILTPMKSMGLVNYDLYKKTYSVSTKFKKALLEIGLMWSKVVDK
jgi:aminoglycoside N3'-acetyltransferase